jgi:hypothetical protein
VSQYDDPASDYYHDDSFEQEAPIKSKSKLTFKLVLLAIASFIGYTTLGTTFAANVQLGSGVVEFGQGVRMSTACDSSITVTPFATFANASGSAANYKLTSIQVTDISSSCYGKNFIIRAFDSATATPLNLYQTGGTTTYNSIRIYNNSGTFSLADSGLTQSEITPVTGGFRVTLFNSASPASVAMAAATSVFRLTVESVEHDASLTQTSQPSGSMIFNGSTSTVDYAANSAFVLGTGAFTLEVWAKLGASQGDETFYDAGGDVNSPSGFAFWVEFNELKIRRDGCCGDITVAMESAWRDGAYHHFAVVRGNGKYRIFVDGVLKVEAVDSGHNINRNAPVVGGLSAYRGYSYELGGDLRNLRVVKGTALYSANFTPPTVPLSKVSGTLLLLLSQDSTNPTKDSSDNQWAPSNSGTLPTYRAP